MKLPEDKKERIQILVLIGLGCVTAIVLLVMLGARPLLDKKKVREEKIADLEKQVTEARGIVKVMPSDREQNRKILARIKEYSDQHMLHPRLGGNYRLGAGEAVEALFKKAGMEQGSFSPGSPRVIPQQQAARRAVQFFPGSVSLRCGTHELIGLLKVIEESDSFLTVSRLSISADPNPTPKELPKHAVSLSIEWPIWTDMTMPEQIEAQLKTAAGSGKGAQ